MGDGEMAITGGMACWRGDSFPINYPSQNAILPAWRQIAAPMADTMAHAFRRASFTSKKGGNGTGLYFNQEHVITADAHTRRDRRQRTALDDFYLLHQPVVADPVSARHGHRIHSPRRGGDRRQCFSGERRQRAESGRRTTGLQTSGYVTSAKPDP